MIKTGHCVGSLGNKSWTWRKCNQRSELPPCPESARALWKVSLAQAKLDARIFTDGPGEEHGVIMTLPKAKKVKITPLDWLADFSTFPRTSERWAGSIVMWNSEAELIAQTARISQEMVMCVSHLALGSSHILVTMTGVIFWLLN